MSKSNIKCCVVKLNASPKMQFRARAIGRDSGDTPPPVRRRIGRQAGSLAAVYARAQASRRQTKRKPGPGPGPGRLPPDTITPLSQLPNGRPSWDRPRPEWAVGEKADRPLQAHGPLSGPTAQAPRDPPRSAAQGVGPPAFPARSCGSAPDNRPRDGPPAARPVRPRGEELGHALACIYNVGVTDRGVVVDVTRSNELRVRDVNPNGRHPRCRVARTPTRP